VSAAVPSSFCVADPGDNVRQWERSNGKGSLKVKAGVRLVQRHIDGIILGGML
jgi:hypothetical protein